MNKRIYIVILIIFVLSGCSPKPTENESPPPPMPTPVVKKEEASKAKIPLLPRLERKKHAQILMGTTVEVDICHERGKEAELEVAMVKVWDRLGEIHWRMSIFDQKSDVWKVNRAYQNPTIIGQDTYDLLKRSVKYHKLTSGAFDITIGPLVEYWHGNAQTNYMPMKAELRTIQKSVGIGKLRFHGESKVEILHSRSRIDLGGVAKGYAIDEAARLLREAGFEQFLINAGGDMYAGGLNCKDKPWRIGIKDPRDTNQILDIVEVTDAAVTTSGDYEQSMEIHGQLWSHIINPITGFPQKGVVSATVIAPTAEKADALSTAMTVMGKEEGVNLINRMGKKHACLLLYADSKDDLNRSASQSYVSYKIDQ